MTHFNQMKKSTTLFPQRVLNSPLTNEKLVSDNDAFRSEHTLHAVSSSNSSQCRVIKLNESWKIKLETSQKQSEDTLNLSGCKPSISNSSKSLSPKKNKLSLKLKSVKCFLCNRIIKVEHIPEHLLFCEVKCAKCSAVFKECQDFQLWTVESKMGNVTCEHVLQYSRNPLESIKVHLFNHLENGSTGRALEINSHIRTYINGMNSLRNKLPWQQAVSLFKKFEGSKGWELQTENEIVRQNERNGEETVIHSNPNNNNPILMLGNRFNGSSSISLQDGRENPNLKNIQKFNGKEFTSKDYCPKESIKAPKHDLSSKTKECSPNKIPQQDSKSPRKKRKNSEWAAGLCKKKLNGSKHNKSTDYVQTPSDGFYYVVRHSITECPNCYEHISPPDFTVNIVTFLMTAVCSGCGLTIYIVHDPPDESGPRVCIVTDQKPGKANKLRHHISQRKKFTHKSLPEAVIG